MAHCRILSPMVALEFSKIQTADGRGTVLWVRHHFQLILLNLIRISATFFVQSYSTGVKATASVFGFEVIRGMMDRRW